MAVNAGTAAGRTVLRAGAAHESKHRGAGFPLSRPLGLLAAAARAVVVVARARRRWRARAQHRRFTGVKAQRLSPVVRQQACGTAVAADPRARGDSAPQSSRATDARP